MRDEIQQSQLRCQQNLINNTASEMTYIVSGWALNSTQTKLINKQNTIKATAGATTSML